MVELNEKATTDKDESKDIIERRKEKLAKIIKIKKTSVFNIISYCILGLITLLSIFIRTRNMPGLKDITTGTWTLGPDLDPFLFLRWAEYIVEHGKLMVIDTMRYVPLGYNTSGEAKLLSYLIAWLYDFLHIFNQNVTVTYAAIIFPVIMFALTCIAFFFLTKKIFWDHFEDKRLPSAIALIATFFLSIIPEILPRTIAGIPEKESVGFLLIILSIYWFICSFKSKTYSKSLIYGMLAGISTGLLGLVWGGVTFAFAAIGASVFVYFIFGRVDRKRFVGYLSWIVLFMAVTMPFSSRFNLINFISSTTTIPIFATLGFTVFDIFIYPYFNKLRPIKKINEKYHVPSQIWSIVIIGIIALGIFFILFGKDFVANQISEATTAILKPLSSNRFSVTVAENRLPYFNELTDSFGPLFLKLPLFFWLFVISSILIFYKIVEKFDKREKYISLTAYIILLVGLTLSRYSQESPLNGESNASLILYFGSMFLFFLCCLYIYFYHHKKSELEKLNISFEYILLIILFVLCIIAARNGVRFIMMLVPPGSILVAYIIVASWKGYFSSKTGKDDTKKMFVILLAIIITLASLYSAYSFYKEVKAGATGYYPSSYQWQWQKAMKWIRDNTPETAVFAHWWDYGYWLQSIGNRATIVDGGNAIVYWDYLVGRHVLTTPTDEDALEFLYTHNATNLLIDSTDIGKYSAFSSIGSNADYDRYSFIPTFSFDQKSSKETKTGMLYTYTGGAIGLDGDVSWNDNGTRIDFAKENSIIGAIVFEEYTSDNESKVRQPQAIFIQQGGKQTAVPLRYLYYKNKLYDFNNGLDAGIFVVEVISPINNQIQINDKGAIMYLSSRTVHSLLVRKYLFQEEGNFKLVYSEPNGIIDSLRSQGVKVDDFAYYSGNFLGPIKIWEINYPKDTKPNPAYLQTSYPNTALTEVNQ